ncbi:MAG: nucleotide-binding protein [Ferroplasma sp.]
MVPAGDMNFRIGGYTGMGGMFLGRWNDLSETTQTFSLYKCPQCGKIDFYEPELKNAEESGEKNTIFYK